MNEQSVIPLPRGRKESGFALILAILALMLLTFLGLTLAATTSTELQIATNYRWSQQALYNAEAGIEAGKLILSRIANPTTGWLTNLPPQRTGGAVPWVQGAAPAPGGGTGRDYSSAGCAGDRAGVGYGLVLTEGATRYEGQDAFMASALNGAFTLWVRRDLVVDNTGRYRDEPDNATVVLTAEGVAPYTSATTAFTRVNQATRVIEVRFNLEVLSAGDPCIQYSGQQGQGPGGDNFNPCAVLKAGAGGSLVPSFGAAGSATSGGGTVGTLAGTGVE